MTIERRPDPKIVAQIRAGHSYMERTYGAREAGL